MECSKHAFWKFCELVCFSHARQHCYVTYSILTLCNIISMCGDLMSVKTSVSSPVLCSRFIWLFTYGVWCLDSLQCQCQCQRQCQCQYLLIESDVLTHFSVSVSVRVSVSGNVSVSVSVNVGVNVRISIRVSVSVSVSVSVNVSVNISVSVSVSVSIYL